LNAGFAPSSANLLLGGALQIHGRDAGRYQRAHMIENFAHDAAARRIRSISAVDLQTIAILYRENATDA
jgi:hypothetical protein